VVRLPHVPSPFQDVKPSECMSQAMQYHGYWTNGEKGEKTWNIGGCKGNLYNTLMNTTIQQFRDAVHKRGLIIIGDSHLRYVYLYMLQSLNLVPRNILGKFHHNHHVQNVYFFWNRQATNLSQHLQQSVHPLGQNQSKPILIMDVGPRDLQLETIRYVVTTMQPVLRFIQENPDFDYMWYGQGSFPDKDNNWIFRGSRNNYSFPALNAWALKHMKKMGIPVFDIWPISLALQNKTVCGAHHLCYNKRGFSGAAGKYISNMMISYIAEKYNQLTSHKNNYV